ncbi:MAG TPA: phosphoribosylformylglycinamidine synthase subunit PurS [Candidatus Dormibacteraeota bacterium]|nr:phosphoribosylformylglycinamidine synthase subunit PurS [Candidatus Dormibacteraeota bacterium]
MNWVAEVVVTLKPVVNDPQGITVRDGLHRLGFAAVQDVRVGKHIEIEVDAADESSARALVTEMSERLLRNPVIEDYHIAGVEARSAVG